MGSGMNTLVEVINADFEHLAEELNEAHSVRLYARGGHFSKDELIPVYFMLIYGCYSADEYNNFLYNLRKDINKERPFAFIDTPLDEPSPEVTASFLSIDRSSPSSIISGLCSLVDIKNSPKRNLIAQKALGDMLSMSNNDNFNSGLSMVLKLNLIANAIDAGRTDEIPMIMYYGTPTPSDTMFLCYAQRCGFDIVCISPDKSTLRSFEICPFADKLQKIELEASRRIMPFPTKLVKSKIATVAYNAERELDTQLYGGDTFFRDRQFSKMESAVLKTTLDEVMLLWDQSAKFRPGFAVRGETVVIPTIFAKINGVDDGDLKAYWEMVDDLITPDTVYIIKTPSGNSKINVSRAYASFHNGWKIDVQAIKHSPAFKFGYFPEHLINQIFEKLQAMIDDGLLMLDTPAECVEYAIHSVLTLDKNILRLLQKFDYTKDIPKIIIADTIESTFTKLECTQLLLLSYLGFDVLILSPSGYRDIELYVSEKAFETHTFNQFAYDIVAPKFRIPTEPKVKKKKNGFLSNLFKKGR